MEPNKLTPEIFNKLPKDELYRLLTSCYRLDELIYKVGDPHFCIVPDQDESGRILIADAEFEQFIEVNALSNAEALLEILNIISSFDIGPMR
jgi:hypothetical protein